MPRFGIQLFEIDGLWHEDIGSALKDLLFILSDTADDDDGGLVRGIGLDAAADLESIDTGNHDVEDKQIGLQAAHLDQGIDSVGCGCHLVASLPLKVRLDETDNLFFVVDDQDSEFPIDQ